MPWNNQNGGGGGWKSGGGPWGQGPGGGGQHGPGGGGQQPDLEEMLKRGQDRMKQVMHSGGVPGPLLLLIAAIAAAFVGFFAFTFTVRPDELGVVPQHVLDGVVRVVVAVRTGEDDDGEFHVLRLRVGSRQ